MVFSECGNDFKESSCHAVNIAIYSESTIKLSLHGVLSAREGGGVFCVRGVLFAHDANTPSVFRVTRKSLRVAFCIGDISERHTGTRR